MNATRLEYYLAKIISQVLHPLWMPLYTFVIVLLLPTYLQYQLPSKAKWILFLIVFLNTGFIPAIIALSLRAMGVMKSLERPEKDERNIPFIFALFFYGFCYYLLLKNQVPLPLRSMVLGATAGILLNIAINFFWKISTHMIGIGGFVGALLAFCINHHINALPIISFSFLAAGLLGFSRLRLNAHTPAQVYAGFIAGWSTVFLFVFFSLG